MTDIGTELLRLLTDRFDEWEFVDAFGGFRHKPTGTVLVTSAAAGNVILMCRLDGILDSVTRCLSDADHVALYAVLKPLTDERKAQSVDRETGAVRRILGLN